MVTIEDQFIAVVGYAIRILGSATVERIKSGPARAAISRWEKRPNANYGAPRLSGVVSDLCEKRVLRVCGMNGKSPVYAEGPNFARKMRGIYNNIFCDVQTSRENGEIVLLVPQDMIIPVETLHEAFCLFDMYDWVLEAH